MKFWLCLSGALRDDSDDDYLRASPVTLTTLKDTPGVQNSKETHSAAGGTVTSLGLAFLIGTPNC